MEVLGTCLVGVVGVHQEQARHVVAGVTDSLDGLQPRIRVHDHRHDLRREEGPAHDRNDVQCVREDFTRDHQIGAAAGLGVIDDFGFDSFVVFHC